MQLTTQQRQSLRRAMLDAFDFHGLCLFAEDQLGIDPTRFVPATDRFEIQCQKLIKWLESQGKIEAFCKAILADPDRQNAALKSAASDILAATAGPAAAGGGPARPFVINKRPLLNRNQLWQKLLVFAEGNGAADRVLIVTGDSASGKTYSQFLVGHVFSPRREDCQFALIDLTQSTAPEVDGVLLAQWISDRSWPRETAEGRMQRFDDLAQAPRQVKSIGEMLVERLAALPKPTWLLIDGLNAVRVGATAISLLNRLCRAIELAECPNLWLILVGINLDHPELESLHVFTVDQASRPSQTAIREYLAWFLADLGIAETAVALDDFANQLDAILPAQPTHESWNAFHKALIEKCAGIREDMNP